MSLLNDVLRDLDKRNAGQGEGPPDGVPPGLFMAGDQHGRGNGGFGRGQLMKLVVWVLILLGLITAVIVGWRTLDFGRQALDRIPVDENLQAVPRNLPLAGEVKPVKPLPQSITAPESTTAAIEVSEPVPTSQYPVPERASLSGPSPGEPDSGAGGIRDSSANSSSSSSSSSSDSDQSDAPAPTVTVVGEREVIVAPQREVKTVAISPEKPEARPTTKPSADSSGPAPVAKAPEKAERPAAPTAAPAEMKVATLAARRLDEARALQASGQTDAALALFSRLEPSIAAPARAPALFSFKAGLLQQQGRYEEAAGLYAALLKMKSTDAALKALEARWWSGLAIAQEQLREPERAHAAWLNALAAGGLPATTRSYAAGRIAALGQAGIKPDYQSVLDTSSSATNKRQDQP